MVETTNMRRHGWAGNIPADDDEAIARILEATRACIDRDGDSIGIADVARELGVSRPTIYRYFRTTEDLLTATALEAAGHVLDDLEKHLRKRKRGAAEAVVESIAYTIERIPHEPYLSMLLTPGRISLYAEGFTQPNAVALGRAMVERFPVDWAAEGITSDDLDELVEQMLRMTQSLILDSGTPQRDGAQLRAYLNRWLAPVVVPPTITGRQDRRR